VVRPTADRLAGVIGLFFVLLALVYASVTPIFEPPDEAAHFLYIHNLLRQGELPVMQDRRTTIAETTPLETRLSLQIHHPPLYYLGGALLISWTQRADVLDYLQVNPFAAYGVVTPNNQNVFLHRPAVPTGDTALAVYILRLYSIALAAGTLTCVYRTARLIVGARTALVALLLVASIPTFIFISASINNDNLVTFFYSAGVYWCVSVWQHRAVTRRDALLISLILAGIALSKLPGLSLFGVVYGWLIYGLWRGRFNRNTVLRVLLTSSLLTLLLAGWWYLRNHMIYGDFLAMQASLNIWSRGQPPTDPQIILSEAKGVWESLWMILGQFNIRGPDWLYAYLPIITLTGIVGALGLARRHKALRSELLLLSGVCLLMIAVLAYTTRQANVSQGRILFPALVAFAPLLAAGWRHIIGRWLGVLCLLPLTLIALRAPLAELSTAYAPPETITALPAQARRIDAQSEGLTLLAYQLQQDTLQPAGILRLTLYLQGQHPEDPVLFVKALDPITQTPVGGADLYPGMSPTSALDPQTIYAVQVAFRLDPSQLSTPPPYRLNLQLGWRVLKNDRFLPLEDAQGRSLAGLVLPGPTLLDESLSPPAPTIPADVTYGGIIQLTGYDRSAQSLKPGDTLTIILHWRALGQTPDDYVVAVGLIDSAGTMIANADAMPAGYPTSAWRTGTAFLDTRVLHIPPDTPPAELRLYLAWYDPLIITRRLPASGAHVQPGDLFLAPEVFQVVIN